MKNEILVVEDEVDIGRLIQDILQDEGYTSRLVHSGEQAITAVKQRCPNLILLDIWLGESRFDGLRVLKEVKKNFSEIPIVMMTGHGSIETAVSAMKEGAYDFLEKPFKSERLILIIKRALETSYLLNENKELKSKNLGQFELIGKSVLIQNLRETIAKVAITNSRILISGESGSGKETVAREIHKQSVRHKGPLIIFNCTSVPCSEVDALLFGIENKEGVQLGIFEKAHNGTLVLEEINALNLDVQTKLVKVLHQNSFERNGSGQKIEVNVRIIASTTQNLFEQVTLKTFREDLYYRLNIVPILVPTLSKRLEDIEQLANHFIHYFSKINNKAVKKMTQDAVIALQSHSWPGNVRQLKNIIEWIVIMHGDDESAEVDVNQLPLDLLNEAPAFLALESMAKIMQLPLREARDQFERNYLQAQITRFSGNISQTANFIGMERSALHRKFKSLAIKRPLSEQTREKLIKSQTDD